jgi:uncharacterized protein (DUF342 family)
MGRKVIVEGDTYNTTLEKGLKALGAEPGKVKVEILEEGKTMMGRVLKPYKLLLSLHKDINKEKKSTVSLFSLEYRDDGVYLIVFPSSAELTKAQEQLILQRLKRKKIEELKTDAVAQAMYTLNGLPVKIAESQVEIPIDEEVLIRISQDQMQASIMLLPPEGGRLLSFEDIVEIIKNSGVVYGIDEESIRKLLANRKYGAETTIAWGKSPQKGEDAKLTFCVDFNKKPKPKINEDGTVNYHFLDIIENVKKGQILATLTPPTQGIPGKTVMGDPIAPKPGKTMTMPKGKNVIVSKDGLKLFAAIDGKVEMINDKIHVYSVYEVRHNVDHSTGDIDFIGNVIVYGNVLSGFKVKAGGYIEVRGVVEGATLIAQGDVLLRKGLQGMKKGFIQAGGNVIARFIENGSVYAKGDIIAEAIMHSDVQSGQYVKVSGKKGLIVGGKVHAVLGISAYTIGSPMATSTSLEVGIHPEIREEYDSIKIELERLEKEQKKMDQILTLLNRMENTGNLSPKKQQAKRKALRMKLEYYQRIPAIKARILELEETFLMIADGKIHIRKIIYPGVSIVIGASMSKINDTLQYVTFKRDEGEIRFTSYEG